MSENRKDKYVLLPGQTPEGEYILSILIKRTYKILPNSCCVRADKDQKIIAGDAHYDTPMNSSVRFEADFVPYKIATDVVLNGKAYAPNGKAVETLKASLIIDKFRKDIQVFGNRRCIYQKLRDPIFTRPEPFTTMDIRYELAYGGVDVYSNPDVAYAYPRNHLGRGFVIGTEKNDNLLLPNIEDPEYFLTPAMLSVNDIRNWEKQPMPQGFGWFCKFWLPRATFAGVMPADRATEQEFRKAYSILLTPEQREKYEKEKLPDMDFRFFNGASQGLALPFLSGNEVIRLIHLTPEKDVSFQLPGEVPNIRADIGMGLQYPPVVLHTVMLRMEEQEADLVWRGAILYPGPDWLPKMTKMEVTIQ